MRTIQRVSADEDEAELHDDIVVPGITTLRHVTRDRGSNLGFAEAGFLIKRPNNVTMMS